MSARVRIEFKLADNRPHTSQTGVDYEVQRVTSTYHPSGDYSIVGVTGGARSRTDAPASGAGGLGLGGGLTTPSGAGLRSAPGARGRGVAAAAVAGSTSPLDDLLNHVNTLLKVRTGSEQERGGEVGTLRCLQWL